MKIEKISLGNKLKNYFIKDSNSKINSINEIIDFITQNNYFIASIDSIRFDLNPQKDFSYQFSTKSINIPIWLDNHKNDLYKGIELYTNEKTMSYIIFHEIGHAIQHSSIGEKDYLFEPIELNSKLNYLFNGASIAHKINHFLADNFKESYADCYAAFNLYKKYGDINVFDEIYSYREFEKLKFKSIYHEGINEYFSHNALLIFKESLVKNVPFEKIHEIIQRSIVKSLFKTVVDEMKTNDSFLKEIKSFGVEFNKQDPVSGFLKEFKNRSNNIIDDDIEELMKDSLFQRKIDNAKPLNNIRKDGYNFVNDNIKNIRNKNTNKKSLLNY